MAAALSTVLVLMLHLFGYTAEFPMFKALRTSPACRRRNPLPREATAERGEGQGGDARPRAKTLLFAPTQALPARCARRRGDSVQSENALEVRMILRDFDPARDKQAALAFIMGSQHYEHGFEPDRRLDPQVAEEFLPEILKRVAARRERIFVAEEDGIAIGWAVFTVEQNMLYVVEAERTYGYIAELFVTETARSRGVGRALIAACENEARRQGLGHIMIGVLTKSTRTAEIYARAGYGPYSSELRKYL